MSLAIPVTKPPRRTSRWITWSLALVACLLAAVVGGPWIKHYALQLWQHFVPSDQITIVQDLGFLLIESPNDARGTSEPPRIAHSFTVENPSADQPLVLVLEKRSCGCLSVKQPDPIPPRGTARIELAFSPSGQSEVRSELVSFKTNRDRPRLITLVLKAHTLPRVEFVGPRRCYIPYGGPYRVEAVLRYHSATRQAPAATQLFCDPPQGTPQWTGPWQTEKLANNLYRHSRRFALNLEESAVNTLITGGALFPELLVKFPDRNYRFPIEISSNPPLRVSPRALFLTDATPTPIEIAADHPFRIRHVSDSLQLLECNVDNDEPNQVHTLHVALAKPPEDNVAETLLSVELDGLDVPKVTLPVYAFGPSGK